MAAEAEAEDLAAQARKLEREEQRAAEAKRHSEHYTRMYEEIGQPLAGLNEAQHGIVYSRAWEQGHSSGFDQVESDYEELAEMARKLLEAK
jgi:hypothetical protein